MTPGTELELEPHQPAEAIGELPAPPHRPKRKRMFFWDRIKVVVVFTILWWLLVWSDMADNPLLGLRDAVHDAWQAKWWMEALVAIEIVRQIHYFVCERWSRYHRLWSEGVFGGFERRTLRLRDWTRYRIARMIRVAVWVVFIAIIAGALTDESPIQALFELPSRVFQNLPFIFQMLAGVVFVLIQFIALFWFLSRGGTDVYFPDDIKTRFTDVWGQDAILNRVSESMMFLEDPDAIESRGGYVPGGILLWGPPGTGKTLMAEAVAGETGKPFVFVDPGAFTNMFMGVGILKVKGLFRKLRKLAVRYGGVIVFFDEADALGNRGMLSGGGIFGGGGIGGRGATSAFAATPGCHGSSYLSAETSSILLQSHLDAHRHDEAVARGGSRSRMMPMGMGGGGGMGHTPGPAD